VPGGRGHVERRDCSIWSNRPNGSRPSRWSSLTKVMIGTWRRRQTSKRFDRKVYPVVPPMVEYSLMPMGRLFIEPIEMLYAWAAKNDEALSKLRRRRKKHTASRDCGERAASSASPKKKTVSDAIPTGSISTG